MTIARGLIERIYASAVDAVDPRSRVRDAIQCDPGNRELRVAGQTIEVPTGGVYLIAIGKAAVAMTEGALDSLGDLVESGIVVTKELRQIESGMIEVIQGAHPVPDQRSINAGDAVIRYARAVPAEGLVICLISGGGSALVESPRQGVELESLQSVTAALLDAGANIQQLNAVRARLSRIKSGGLLRELRQASVVNLIVSDVLGDNLETIASGPSTLPAHGGLRAEEVLQEFDVDFRLPMPVESVDLPPPLLSDVVANLDRAIDAAARTAVRLGLQPIVLTNRLEGEARVAGKLVGSILRHSNHSFSMLSCGSCLIAGGESTVTVRGDGTGGRNTEAALAAALELRGTIGLTLGFLATDGDDGTTGAAGAIIDGATIPESETGDAVHALRSNDSFGFLSRKGATWSPGPTGTNVNDLVIGIVNGDARSNQ